MKVIQVFALFLALLLSGCGEDLGEFGRLFDKEVNYSRARVVTNPGGTPNQIKGLWSLNGLSAQTEIRYEVGADYVISATRCKANGEDFVAGKKVPAEVTNNRIVLKADLNGHKDQGGVRCFILGPDAGTYNVTLNGTSAMVIDRRQVYRFTKISNLN